MTDDNYYLLLGGAEHLGFFEHNYEHEQWFWTVPQVAKAGETAFVYLTAPVSRIVGRVRIVGEPFYNIDILEGAKVKNKWVAEIGDVVYYEPRTELTIRGLRALFPDWAWLRYPRGKTKIPKAIVAPLLALTGSLRDAP